MTQKSDETNQLAAALLDSSSGNPSDKLYIEDCMTIEEMESKLKADGLIDKKGYADWCNVLDCIGRAYELGQLDGAKKVQKAAATKCDEAADFHTRIGNAQAAVIDQNRAEDIRNLNLTDILKGE